MSFKIIEITTNSIIEILAMNIDNENNLLIAENNRIDILRIEDFKDMVLGKTKDIHDAESQEPTHRLFKD